MCGIAGVVAAEPETAERAVRAMNAVQAHRGPDDEGIATFRFGAGYLSFGHRRLSILDLSPAGHQPMVDPESGDAVVYNGEIYNHRSLSEQLAGAGVCFKGHCDTEVLLQAFERWGPDCFGRLDGMYAAAFHQPSRQRLVLCRDPLGIKPLYYASTDRGFVFASELRAILASGLVSPEIDRRAVAGLLAYGSVPQPLTMIRGVEMLGGGTWLELEAPSDMTRSLRSRTQRFWSIPAEGTPPAREEAVAELTRRLLAAASSHLMSDVPVGVFLSSGIDSTAIAALCQQAAPDRIDTFTISLPDDAARDESRMAARTAELLGTNHHTIELPDATVREEARRWLGCLDQPSLDGLNTFIIAGAVRARGIKVALSGLGGDEVFGGYPEFVRAPRLARLLRLARPLPAAMRVRLAEAAFRGRSSAVREKARDLATTEPTVEKVAFRLRRIFADRELRVLGFDPHELELDDTFLLRTEPDVAELSASPTALVSALELRHYMTNTLLRDSDVFGMAHGLEIRVPLLDQDLVDYAMTLPGAWRVRRGQRNKPLLTDALEGVLPQHNLRMPKQGFVLQQERWMRGPLREQFEAGLVAVRESGQLDGRAAKRVWDDYQSGRHGDHWARAWLLGILGVWLATLESRTSRGAAAIGAE